MIFFVLYTKECVPHVGKPFIEDVRTKSFENLPQFQAWFDPLKAGHLAHGWRQTIDTSSGKEFRKEVKADKDFPGGHAIIRYVLGTNYDPEQFFTDDQLTIIRDMFTEQLSRMSVSSFIEARDANGIDCSTIHLEELGVINVVQRRMHLEPYKDLLDFFERGRSGSFNT